MSNFNIQGREGPPAPTSDAHTHTPMQLHWALLLWGPRVMLCGQVVHFCQVFLALENCRNVL